MLQFLIFFICFLTKFLFLFIPFCIFLFFSLYFSLLSCNFSSFLNVSVCFIPLSILQYFIPCERVTVLPICFFVFLFRCCLIFFSLVELIRCLLLFVSTSLHGKLIFVHYTNQIQRRNSLKKKTFLVKI